MLKIDVDISEIGENKVTFGGVLGSDKQPLDVQKVIHYYFPPQNSK